jgi:hypothetical protein
MTTNLSTFVPNWEAIADNLKAVPGRWVIVATGSSPQLASEIRASNPRPLRGTRYEAFAVRDPKGFTTLARYLPRSFKRSSAEGKLRAVKQLLTPARP